jgi:hypothetical protein
MIGGIALGVLGALFVGLKLSDVIAWSWWLVLSPLIAQVLYVPFLLALHTFLDFISKPDGR